LNEDRIDEEEIDLRDYLEVIIRRKWIIIGVTLAAVIGAGIISFFALKPVYQATSIVMISRPKYQVELEPKIQTFIPSTELSLETYANLIKSGSIEQKVIEKISLNQPPNELTVEDLDKMLSVEIIKDTNLIRMNLEDSSPRRAMEIVNAWTSLFVKENEDLPLKEVKEAQVFVEKELESSQQALFKAEEGIREFNEKNKIDILEKEIEEILNKTVSYGSRLADVKMSIKKEEAELRRVDKELASQKKILMSFDVSQLIAGMKHSEARDFIEKRLALSKQNLNAQEEELKKFNQESRISLLKKEIESKASKIVGIEGRLLELKVLIGTEKARIEQAKQELANQSKTFTLTKSIYDDVSLSQLASELSKKEFLLLKDLRFKSEESNPLYLNLEQKIINSMINLDTYQSEATHLEENLIVLRKELEEAKKVYEEEQLKLTVLERKVEILENTYKTLAEKEQEIKIVGTTSLTQNKVISPTNPEYLMLQRRLIESNIEQEILLAEKSELEKNIANFKTNLEALKKELAQDKLTQSRLERAIEIARRTFGVLSQKAEEIKISLGATSNTVKVVSLATEPRAPIKPRKKQNILIGGVLGLFVGVLGAFFVEYWEKSGEKSDKP